MNSENKPTLALVCNYDDNSCGLAAYTRIREQSFSEYFNVTVFDLQSGALMRSGEKSHAADQLIEEIASRLAGFDVVSLDLEFGIWGQTLEQCESRFLRCCRAAKRLLLTVHRVDVNKSKSGPFALAQAKAFLEIAQRPDSAPYHIITHSDEEAETLRSVHGFTQVSSHPLSFVTAAEKLALQTASAPGAWKRKLGFEEGDIVVGVFGALSKYKDNKVAIQALRFLPSNYKLVIAGGAHPFSIRPFQTDENIVEILDTISVGSAEKPGIEERIRFTGILDDHAFRQVMQNCDYVVVPYHDAGQLASGVASMAFELGKRVIATHTRLFLGYRKLYGDSFEMYDIGNYIELRDRIMFFDSAKEARMRAAMNNYTPETIASLASRIFAEIGRADYHNRVDIQKLNELVHRLETSAETWSDATPSGPVSGELAHLRQAYAEAINVQNQLKAEKDALRWGNSTRRLRHAGVKVLSRVKRKVASVVNPPDAAFRKQRKKVAVRRFNTILDDAARKLYAPSIEALWLTSPEVMTRKIPTANVQQGFMLAAVEELAKGSLRTRMLCVGSFEDTACTALQALGYRLDAIDPALNVDLRQYCEQHPELYGRYNIVFSTSVIEHVEKDETFVRDMISMTAPGGYAVLTCDFDDKWRPGQVKPSTDVRLYTKEDMARLIAAMGDVELVDEPDWTRDHLDFTISEAGIEMRYAFATLVVRRKPKVN